MIAVVTIAIAVFLVALIINGLFAGYETAFLTSDTSRMNAMADEERSPDVDYILRHKEKKHYMLSAIIIGTHVTLVAACLVLAQLVIRPWLAAIIAIPMFLILAEIIPKSASRRYPNELAVKLVPIMRLFNFLFSPLIWPTVWLTSLLLRFMRSGTEITRAVMSKAQDFRHLIDESAARGSIERDEQEMIHSVMELHTIQAREIMVPRIDIQGAPDTATREELVSLFEETGLTRVPVYQDTIDTIVGVANVYDVLLDSEPERSDIQRFARGVMHVPDSKPVDDLLQELKDARQHMAIVTDEYGGTDGLITLEDILEEIFGEIHDEHDRKRDLLTQVGPHAFVIDARMSLEDVSEEIGHPIEDEEVETIGGWVMRAAGRIPAQGEKLKWNGFRVTILEGQSHQITKVRLDILPEAREDGGPETGGEGNTPGKE